MADEEPPQPERDATSMQWYIYYSLVSPEMLLSILKCE